jgi:hypothetical protein
MKNLIIEAVPDSPFFPIVNFNAETGICELAGESYMEETYKFYSPLIEWLKQYISEVNKPLVMNVKLSYFNTSSSRLILDIFELISKYKSDGGKANVNWYYDKEDPDMKDEVEDFRVEADLEIKLIEL